MANTAARQSLEEQKMRDIGRMFGFFSAYSQLQTGTTAFYSKYGIASICNPRNLSDPRSFPQTKEDRNPQVIYLKEDDCRCLYMEGWNEGKRQGTLAYETGDLDMIGEIARLAGRVAPFYTDYTTAENDARTCKVLGETRIHFITSWRETGGDRRKQKGV